MNIDYDPERFHSRDDYNLVISSVRDWAREMHLLDACVLDTETTGLALDDEIIELAIVQTGTGNVLFNSRFLPDKKINYYSSLKHGIFKKHLKDKPKFAEHSNRILEIISSRPVIAYNSAFDKRILEQTCKRYDINVPEISWFCAMLKFKELVGYKTNQTAACEYFGVTPGDHSAVNDALAAARIVWKLSR